MQNTLSAAQQRLVARSLEVIIDGQTPEGAYLAAPTFPTYRYSWFRDGSFIADAMDLHAQHASSAAFHAWVVSTLTLRLDDAGEVVGGDVLHTRYLPDGSTGEEDWPNFQLDGFGTWLWAFRRHLQAVGRKPSEHELKVVRRLALHLTKRWAMPNFDCWEEHQDRVHPSTLGALFAGLGAAGELLADAYFVGVADTVRAYVLVHGVVAGQFVKHVGEKSAVDANLLWLAVPYGVVPADSELALRTVRAVESTIQDHSGGVHRYARDTYYGGGSWLLLTADLAQVYLAQGRRRDAERLLHWIEDRATPAGDMPEQVAEHANDPEYIRQWEELWGSSACPLLWSHAAYLRLVYALNGSNVGASIGHGGFRKPGEESGA